VEPSRDLSDDLIPLRRALVRFPLELRTPEDFRPDDPVTWPEVPGRLEYVSGRLLYMPPCGDHQRYASSDVVTILVGWARGHTEFVAGGNEAGMKLGGDVRAADCAVWRVAGHEPLAGRFARIPPVLAVEVAGEEESEAQLRTKAGWYLAHDVTVVWLVLPALRHVVVLTRDAERRYRPGERLAAHPALPELQPAVEDFFRQLDRLQPPG
jgi:Uma2 family endonuclease